MPTEQLLHTVTEAIEDLKGRDVRVLDVREMTSITDYMVIVSGTSDRHIKSIADNVIEKAKAAGFRTLGVEGREQGEWVLIDLGDVVTHVMQPEVRDFYQLERLWAPQQLTADRHHTY